MAFRSWAFATTTVVIVLAVSCSQSSSNGSSANEAGAPGTASAGAPDDASSPDDRAASGASFGGASGEAGAASTSLGGAPEDVPSTRDLSCMGVLQCAGACPDADVDACVEACVNRTRKSSETVTAAFIQCIVDNECPDAECIQTQCENELGACAADDASDVQGTPSEEPPPTASVPRNLVGLWSQVGLSTGMSYEFEADGTTIQAFMTESTYGCYLKTQVSSTGVTTVDGDSLIYHREEGTTAFTTCGTVKSQVMAPADIAYRYTLGTDDAGDPQLSLYRVNEDGTLSSPIDLHR